MNWVNLSHIGWVGHKCSSASFNGRKSSFFMVKQKRLASGVKVLQKVGNQLVEPKAAVEAR